MLVNWCQHTGKGDHLRNLNVHKSMGEMYHSVLKALADVLAKSLSIIFEKSWQSDELLCDWKRENIVPLFNKGRREDPGNS